MQKLKKLQETRRNLRKNKKGFTLVELLVVLAILAILIAVAVPTLTGVLNDAKDKTYLQEARAAYIAYLLKATDQTAVNKVTKADIQKYTSTTPGAIGIAVTDADVPTDVAYFYYAPEDWATSGTATKHIEIPLSTGGSTKGTIASGDIPSKVTVDGTELTITKLS